VKESHPYDAVIPLFLWHRPTGDICAVGSCVFVNLEGEHFLHTAAHIPTKQAMTIFFCCQRETSSHLLKVALRKLGRLGNVPRSPYRLMLPTITLVLNSAVAFIPTIAPSRILELIYSMWLPMVIFTA
jgi:hypothetical protein